MKRIFLYAAISIFAYGCGTTVEACYVHPQYGEVCVKYDGKFHVRLDIASDYYKVREVKEWLKSQHGVEVK